MRGVGQHFHPGCDGRRKPDHEVTPHIAEHDHAGRAQEHPVDLTRAERPARLVELPEARTVQVHDVGHRQHAGDLAEYELAQRAAVGRQVDVQHVHPAGEPHRHELQQGHREVQRRQQDVPRPARGQEADFHVLRLCPGHLVPHLVHDTVDPAAPAFAEWGRDQHAKPAGISPSEAAGRHGSGSLIHARRIIHGTPRTKYSIFELDRAAVLVAGGGVLQVVRVRWHPYCHASPCAPRPEVCGRGRLSGPAGIPAQPGRIAGPLHRPGHRVPFRAGGRGAGKPGRVDLLRDQRIPDHLADRAGDRAHAAPGHGTVLPAPAAPARARAAGLPGGVRSAVPPRSARR